MPAVTVENLLSLPTLTSVAATRAAVARSPPPSASKERIPSACLRGVSMRDLDPSST